MNLSTPRMTVDDFIAKWRSVDDLEIAVYQTHFKDVCAIIGHPEPYDLSMQSADYRFERSVTKLEGTSGRADVFYRGHFAVEYKRKGAYKTLHDAYRQLDGYRVSLGNPLVLVVCDIQNWEVHTNFPDADNKPYKFTHEEIRRPEIFQLLKDMFTAPQLLHPNLHSEDVTAVAAKNFSVIAEYLETKQQIEATRIARFITQLVFTMFAEDIRLLPPGFNGAKGLLTEILTALSGKSMQAEVALRALFKAMQNGGSYHTAKIEYFNGSLFEQVEVFGMRSDILTQLAAASSLNWSHVEPSIFGTLFERILDKRTRKKLGAHYTSAAEITRVVEPVLMRPLRRAWERAQTDAAPIRAEYDRAEDDRTRQAAARKLERIRRAILKQVRDIRVLDPACGSGNFLYISLRLLLDMEKAILDSPLWEGLPREAIQVHPRQLFGMETNPIAHALANIVVWIGYLQWKYENRLPLTIDTPILRDLSKKNIRCMDALLTAADGKPAESDWVEVDVIVGNPPFLGGNRIRAELGDDYVDQLFRLYADRVPATADLVAYWFERARHQIETGKARRAGLIATNSIRNGTNRDVLRQIKASGDIFWAMSDEKWFDKGVAVRVSMVGFDGKIDTERMLDGKPVTAINPDLTARVIDITKAAILAENADISFKGPSPTGGFDIDGLLAQAMLASINSSGKANSDVIRPVLNADDIAQRSRGYYTIDFGTHMTEAEAAQYEKPFAYVKTNVYPIRQQNNRAAYRRYWWRYGEARPGMRRAIGTLRRYIATPRVAKHRIFVWADSKTMCNDLVVVFARDDDYFFGVLHSRVHEVWSLRMGSSLEDRPRYTSTSTFETFPFPFPPGTEDRNDPRVAAVSTAARALHAERQAWLDDRSQGDEKDRTLTTLYNALKIHRGQASGTPKQATVGFVQRLAALHDALDRAVCAAYGWDTAILGEEEALLAHLLELNARRANLVESASVKSSV